MESSPLSADSAATEEEYVVEKILDSCINAHGVKEYLLKWLGYDDSENTWESEDCINCPGLIAAYEAERAQKEKEKGKKRRSTRTPAPKLKNEKKLHGFERGLKPEKIIGVIESSGLLLLMKWEGTEEADFVPAKQANVECPQVVISFFSMRSVSHGVLAPMMKTKPHRVEF